MRMVVREGGEMLRGNGGMNRNHRAGDSPANQSDKVEKASTRCDQSKYFSFIRWANLID